MGTECKRFWFFEVFRKEMQMAAACVCFNAINRERFFPYGLMQRICSENLLSIAANQSATNMFLYKACPQSSGQRKTSVAWRMRIFFFTGVQFLCVAGKKTVCFLNVSDLLWKGMSLMSFL